MEKKDLITKVQEYIDEYLTAEGNGKEHTQAILTLGMIHTIRFLEENYDIKPKEKTTFIEKPIMMTRFDKEEK